VAPPFIRQLWNETGG